MFPGLRMPKGAFLREAFMKNYEFWFIVGSQTLYGPEVLETVDARAREMAAYLTERLPYPLVYKGTAKSAEEISAVVREANYQETCCGLVTWCHTFSPSKMWINGLEVLRKPYCHFVTQYNRDIPNDEIDMDFMNLNQAAHGDREHGFAGARSWASILSPSVTATSRILSPKRMTFMFLDTATPIAVRIQRPNRSAAAGFCQ